ncbi:MAG: hypothetical protein JNL10_21610 [Verrucomicrobiales bacterium]|nr:hypothetical protein [Verrucomicrobiales bacterium]
MKPRPFQLEPLHRWIAAGVYGLLFISGFVWWWADESMEEAGKSIAWAEAAKPWLLRVHGAAVMAFLVLLGTLLMVHVRRAWPSGVNRRSGMLLGIWISVQILTGYGLDYLDSDALRDRAGQIHISVGLLSPLVVVGHVVWGRRQMRRRSADSAAARS